MRKTRERRQEQAAWLNPGLELLKGGALGVGVSIVVLLCVAALMHRGVLGRDLMAGCVIGACVLGSLAGGRYAVKHCRRAMLPVGVGAGAVQWMILLCAGAIFFGGVTGVGEMWSVGAGCACGGLLAGVLSALLHTKPKRKR